MGEPVISASVAGRYDSWEHVYNVDRIYAQCPVVGQMGQGGDGGEKMRRESEIEPSHSSYNEQLVFYPLSAPLSAQN